MSKSTTAYSIAINDKGEDAFFCGVLAGMERESPEYIAIIAGELLGNARREFLEGVETEKRNPEIPAHQPSILRAMQMVFK